MIDFIKLNISRSRFDLKNLDFFDPINIDTGEIHLWRTARHENLLIIQKEKFIVLQGSLHKYYNGGEHNWNDFNYKMQVQAIERLCQAINIDAYNSTLMNLEFGINLSVNFNPLEFLQKQVIAYKGKRPTYSGPVKGKGYILQFENSNYIVKLYDKSGQYDLDEKMLRFEIKTKKMAFIRKTGFKMLSDLNNLSRLKILRDILLNVFDGLLICDPLGDQSLSEEEVLLYLTGINPTFWENLLPDSKEFLKGNIDNRYHAERKRYYSNRDKFNSLLTKYNLDKTKKWIRREIENKSARLLSAKENVVEYTLIEHNNH